jgi:endonuclease/exonuclease/phosphatase family metal-dependent hydrolase
MKPLKKIFKVILVVLVLFMAGFIGLILYAVISDYKPEEKELVYKSDKTDLLNDTLELSVLSWNIGYCALDKEMDFFYDGGTKVFTPENQYYENLKGVKDFLKSNDTIDFFLMQEIDAGSKRSFHNNQFDTIANSLNGYNSFFGKNYDVFFVPVPPSTPMGKVKSGVAIYSRYNPSLSERVSFPGEYAFPKQLFMLDRCFLVNRYPVENGRELVIINTHNEAFDPGEIRRAQMTYLRDFILGEYSKGNYIVAGGDWNQSPPDFKPDFPANKVNTDQMKMASDYLPSEWKWIYDNKTPSNRSVIEAYDPATTTTTVIDFFLLSPNIESVAVECVNLGFRNSDHNPVRLKLKIY